MANRLELVSTGRVSATETSLTQYAASAAAQREQDVHVVMQAFDQLERVMTAQRILLEGQAAQLALAAQREVETNRVVQGMRAENAGQADQLAALAARVDAIGVTNLALKREREAATVQAERARLEAQCRSLEEELATVRYMMNGPIDLFRPNAGFLGAACGGLLGGPPGAWMGGLVAATASSVLSQRDIATMLAPQEASLIRQIEEVRLALQRLAD